MDWIQEFCNLLFSPTLELKSIEAAHVLKHKNLPGALYKYRSFSKYSLKNLEDNTVWLSSPRKFNDPFDSAITVNQKKALNGAGYVRAISPEVIKRHNIPAEVLREAKSSDAPLDVMIRWAISAGKITKEVADAAKSAIETVIGKHFEGMQEKIFSLNFDTTKICSFSEKMNSLLMWSHYADYHRGFCIQYLPQKDGLGIKDLRVRMLYPVLYSDTLVDLTDGFAMIGDKREHNVLYPIKAALTKSTDWAYEKEWRLVINGGVFKDDQAWSFLPARAIYLGAMMPKEQKATLYQLAQKKGINIYEMKLSKVSYSLEHTEFKPN